MDSNIDRKNDFITRVFDRASKEVKTIVLPESNDNRVIRAATWALRDGIANIIMIGDEQIP